MHAASHRTTKKASSLSVYELKPPEISTSTAAGFQGAVARHVFTPRQNLGCPKPLTGARLSAARGERCTNGVRRSSQFGIHINHRPRLFYSPAHRKVRDVCSPSRRRGILVPLSRLVPFQAERPAHKLDRSRRYLRLPADALVCRRREKTLVEGRILKNKKSEREKKHTQGALKWFFFLCSKLRKWSPLWWGVWEGFFEERNARPAWYCVPEKTLCSGNRGIIPEG